METDDLNRLIRSLNASGEWASGDATGESPLLEHVRGRGASARLLRLRPGAAGVADGEVSPRLAALLVETVRRGGTDLLLVPGSAPILRLHGALEPLAGPGGERFNRTDAWDLLSPSLSADRRRRFAEGEAIDLSLRVGAARPLPREPPPDPRGDGRRDPRPAEEDPAALRAGAPGLALRADEGGARSRPRHRRDRVGKDDDARRPRRPDQPDLAPAHRDDRGPGRVRARPRDVDRGAGGGRRRRARPSPRLSSRR